MDLPRARSQAGEGCRNPQEFWIPPFEKRAERGSQGKHKIPRLRSG